MKTISKITPSQRQLLELLVSNPRYRTKTKEGSDDVLALAMMGMVHDVYEMAGGGYIGTISEAGRAALASASEELTIADYEQTLTDHRTLVRRLDVSLNGHGSAARQASLCDIVGQVEDERWVLVPLDALIPFAGLPETDEAETAVPNESPVTIRCQLGDMRRLRAALRPLT